jgi:hypothetical protein
MQSSVSNVFVAGGILKAGKDYSPIFTIAEGLRVTKSLERFLKGSSLTLGREYEDYKPTSLVTKTDDIDITPKIIASDIKQGLYKRTSNCRSNVAVFYANVKSAPKAVISFHITNLTQKLM